MYHTLYQYDSEPIEKAPTEGAGESTGILRMPPKGGSALDSSPRFRDSRTDVLRQASQMPCHGHPLRHPRLSRTALAAVVVR